MTPDENCATKIPTLLDLVLPEVSAIFQKLLFAKHFLHDTPVGSWCIFDGGPSKQRFVASSRVSPCVTLARAWKRMMLCKKIGATDFVFRYVALPELAEMQGIPGCHSNKLSSVLTPKQLAHGIRNSMTYPVVADLVGSLIPYIQ